MKVDVEKLERSRVQLTVEVDEAQVAKATDEACKAIAEHVNIPGFRKGRVPRKVLERRLGKDTILREAAESLVDKVYPDAVKQAGISPVSTPEVSIEQIEENKPLIFKVAVDVVPEVELGQYTGIEAEYVKEEVTDEHVDLTLDQIRRRHVELVSVERDTVQQDDVVTIDYEGFIDGEPFEGGKQEGYVLKVGSGVFVPGFEEQLIGAKCGETKEIQVTFPEDYGPEEISGKEAVFKVTIHEIKEEVMPELDDEFAKDVSTFETLEEFRDDLKKRLQEEADRQAKERFRSSLINKVVENASVDLPDSLVDAEIRLMIDDIRQRLAMQGLTFEQYLQFTGKDETGLREEMVDSAKERLKTTLVMSELRSKENITVTDDDIEGHIGERVKALDEEQKERAREFYQSPEQRDSIRQMLLTEKTIEFLEQHAVRIERSGDTDAVDSDGSGTDQ